MRQLAGFRVDRVFAVYFCPGKLPFLVADDPWIIPKDHFAVRHPLAVHFAMRLKFTEHCPIAQRLADPSGTGRAAVKSLADLFSA